MVGDPPLVSITFKIRPDPAVFRKIVNRLFMVESNIWPGWDKPTGNRPPLWVVPGRSFRTSRPCSLAGRFYAQTPLSKGGEHKGKETEIKKRGKETKSCYRLAAPSATGRRESRKAHFRKAGPVPPRPRFFRRCGRRFSRLRQLRLPPLLREPG
jgi:hypothetical protein